MTDAQLLALAAAILQASDQIDDNEVNLSEDYVQQAACLLGAAKQFCGEE